MITSTKILCSGYCTHSNHITDSSISYWNSEIIKFPSLFVLIQHSKFGNILFDTGYSSRFYKETQFMPYLLYGKLTPVFLKENESAMEILKVQFGILPQDVNYIIISHFHADHISGLRDFPNAKFVYSKEGFEYLKERKQSCCCRDIRCCVNGFIPNLLPDDFEKRSIQVSETQFSNHVTIVPPFKSFDLFGDHSLFIVDLPGHCKGHLGCYFTVSCEEASNQDNKNGTFLLIGDAAWSSNAIINASPPHLVTKYLVQYDWNAYCHTLQTLHKLWKEEKNLKIIPSHCWKIYEEYCSNNCYKISKL
ncbi:hypothetical protein C9374_002057 [Naegleria lovaniensis]|uniref:Metallo-beta-lactamase domain-containing protein n=1 Tax=Naegleria lovaniensis TaxID=51637 RepID=A0AA88GQJ3_NAELO|nr:uncharacterized protein C9374_002057 [Naegleria lovaniensis]KAG2387022.1 hypothetical protein C9374_002057 [Naegleria lovaniensis]